MAKHNKSHQSNAGKKMASNIAPPMAAGSPEAPGPINDPRDHPINNVPDATDPREGEVLQAMAAQMGQGGM